MTTDADESFAELLSQFDAILASGQPESAIEGVPGDDQDPEVRERLVQAQDCLRLLESVWPRSQPDVMEQPQSVGRFRIVRELGRGGFGVVYLAHDDKLSRLVALKLQRPEAIVSPQLRSRFIAEARAAGRLRHTNIATIYEVGEAGVRIWLASEYCDAGSLANWLAAVRPTASVQSVAAFMSTLAYALEYSHQQGVLHRDLKPSNVLLHRTTDLGTTSADDLSNYVPKLIDFGLAKTTDNSGQDTRTGALVGTPAYMAPELAKGLRDSIGPATDVYGLGLLLYELLTGRPAFVGENDLVILTKVGSGDFVAPRVIRRELPRDLEAICLKCLQTKPSDRYPSAAALGSDLRRFLLGHQTFARPLTIPQRGANWSRRRPAAAALLTVSLLGSLLLIAMTTLYVTELREARDAMERARVEAETHALDSQKQTDIKDQYLYCAQISLALQDLEQGNSEDAQPRLAPYSNSPELAHLQGFEWHYLRRRMEGDSLTLEGHVGEVYAVQFSPDDELAVSGGQDGTIRFWQKESGKEASRIQAHASCVNSLSYSLDGKLLASGGCDGMVHVWDAETRQRTITLRDQPPQVECVAFSPTSAERLVSCGNDPIVRIWDVTTGLQTQSFDTRGGAVRAAVWSRDGKSLYIAAAFPLHSRPALFVWTPESDHVDTFPWEAPSIALSPTSGELYVGLHDSTIRRLDAGNGKTSVLAGHQREVDALAFSADGRWLASGSDDSRIRLWDLAKGDYLRTLSGHDLRVQGLAFDRQGKTLASASYDHTLRLWKLTQASQQMLDLSICSDHSQAPVRMIALSPDLRKVAAITAPGRLEIKDLESPEASINQQDVPPAIDLQFVDGGKGILATRHDNAQKLLRWESLEQGPVELPIRNAGRHVASLDANYLSSLSPDSAVIYHRQTGHDVIRVDRPSNVLPQHFLPQCALSPNGRLFGVYLNQPNVSWIVRPYDNIAPQRIEGKLWALNDDGSLALLEHSPRISSFELIDTVGRKRIAILTHLARVNHVAFSPDSKSLATGGSDGTVRLWNVKTGQEMAQLPTHSGNVVRVQFSSDGRALGAIVEDTLAKNEDPQTKSVRVFVWSGAREAASVTSQPPQPSLNIEQ